MNDSQPHFRIIKRIQLDSIYSTSGMAATDSGFLVACDDRQSFWEIDENGKTVAEIFNTDFFESLPSTGNGKIEKALKRDYESIASWESQGQTNYFAFGSGSILPQRSFVSKLSGKNQPKQKGEKQLLQFYHQLIIAGNITENQLNIEGSTVKGKDLLLFNRELGIVFETDFAEFEAYWGNSETNPLPEISARKFILPTSSGIQSGFSGATTDQNGRIWVSASAEATNDWVADGQVAGSYIGYFAEYPLLDENKLQIFPVFGDNLKQTNDKIEAIMPILGQDKQVNQIFALTDSDGGISEMLLLEFRNK